MEEDKEISFILGRSLLATGRTLIDGQQGKLILRVQDETITFNVFEAMKFPLEVESCFGIDVVDRLVTKSFRENNLPLPLQAFITQPKPTEENDLKRKECERYLKGLQPMKTIQDPQFEELDVTKEKKKEKMRKSLLNSS